MSDSQHNLNSATAKAEDPSAQYLMFMLGDEVFAIDIRCVREIIQYGSITRVPMMPDFVRGVINLRGAVVPVIDLKARFGWKTADVGKKTCVIIFDISRNGEKAELGVMVDAVSEVVTVAASHIEVPPQFGTVIRREFILGIGKIDQQFIPILDPDKTLDIEEMAGAAEAVAML